MLEYFRKRPYLSIIAVLALLYLRRRLIAYNPYDPKKKRVPSNASILITGCDSGFGRMSAIELAKRGYRVFAGCLTENGRKELADMGYPKLKPFILDVTKRQDIEEAGKLVEKECPEGLFALVNNAGIQDGFLFDWNDNSVARKVMEVNYFAVLEMTKELLPSIIKAKGRIINIASLAAYVPLFGGAAYTSSKHAILGFTKVLKLELNPFDVDAIAICPGFMKTNIVTNSKSTFQKSIEKLSPEKRAVYGDKFIKEMEDRHNRIGAGASDPILVVQKIVEATTGEQPKGLYRIGNDSKFLENFEFLTWWIMKAAPSSRARSSTWR